MFILDVRATGQGQPQMPPATVTETRAECHTSDLALQGRLVTEAKASKMMSLIFSEHC